MKKFSFSMLAVLGYYLRQHICVCCRQRLSINRKQENVWIL